MKLMKNKGAGANYECGHGELEGVLQNYGPWLLERQTFYAPVDRDQRACLGHEENSGNKGVIRIDMAGRASYPPVRRRF